MFKEKFCIQFFLTCILLNSFCPTILAQNQANNWYFGNGAGITFNTNPPSALTDGALSASEGCASISDANGDLLFYTNGITVWNNNHLIMDNGTGLEGDDKSTQSSLIVKMPGNNSMYYIFTVPDQNNQNTGYKFSIVDMSLNGGLGKVITKNEVILKNISDPNSAFIDCTEALTASLHSNQTDIWVVLHQFNTNTFYTYLLTDNGLQAPVTSTLGNQITNLGQCRISPDGKKIAVGGYYGSGVDLYDFNSETGAITNPQSLIGTLNDSQHRIYGLSFSPNSNALYVTNADAEIYQFDLSLPTTADIINSQTTVGHGSGNSYPQIQLGPDNKIYMAQKGLGYLGSIENPDVIGIGCNYIDNKISLNGKNSVLGLPTFMVNYVTPQPPHVSLGNDTTLCTAATLVLDAGNNQNATFLWNTLAQTQTITVTSPGKYYVDVTRGNIKVSDTIIISYTAFAPLSISNSYTFCTNTDPALQLNPVFTQTQYMWQDGSTTLPYSITQPGIYWLERYDHLCKIRDTITVTSNCVIPPPNVSLGNDTTLCPDATLVLDAGNNQNATFVWNTLAQTQTITVTSPGKYYVDVTRGNIKVSDTIIISYISFAPLSISTSYTFCTNTDPALQLSPVFTQTQYMWQDGSTTLPYTITQPGIYWLERYDHLCKIRDTITVTSNCVTPPHVSLGNDTTLCTAATLVLDAGNNQNATFLWNTLAQTQTITVTSPGKYYVDVTRGNIKVSDTIIISYISFAPLSISNSYTFCPYTDPAIQLNPIFTETHYIWQDGSTTLPYTITQSGGYWLERYNQGCTTRDVISITSNCSPKLVIPNVITANGDGMNDTWNIEHMENFPNATIVIYNRWGNIVWKASGKTFQWDGTCYKNGGLLPDGTYFYIIDLKNDSHNESLTGYIQLIK